MLSLYNNAVNNIDTTESSAATKATLIITHIVVHCQGTDRTAWMSQNRPEAVQTYFYTKRAQIQGPGAPALFPYNQKDFNLLACFALYYSYLHCERVLSKGSLTGLLRL